MESVVLGVGNQSYGIPFVKYAGILGRVCGGLRVREANVICRSLGYRFGDMKATGGNLKYEPREDSLPVWLMAPQCQGFENNIGQCPSSNEPQRYCHKRFGVSCWNTTFKGKRFNSRFNVTTRV